MKLSQKQKDDTWIVIPAYNESNSIGKVVKDLIDNKFRNIVVVDDCSSDGTAEVAEKLPVHLLRHTVNRGQGASLKTGIDFALSKDAKYIVTFDSDGQHRVEDLDPIILPVANNQCEITLGSRFINNKTKMPFPRYLTLKIAVIVQAIFYGIWLTDAHNGFRCLSQVAAKKIQINSDRMEHASEIVEEIKKNKLIYKEIPVTINYSQKTLQKGQGSFLQAVNVFWKMVVKKVLK